MVDNNLGVQCENGESYNLVGVNTQELLQELLIQENVLCELPSDLNIELTPLEPKPLRLEHLNKNPVLDEFDTDFSFEVNLHSMKSGKNSWMYSSKLSKVFIKMNQPFSVDISYAPSNVHLFLRAMIVYSAHEELHNPVLRCHNHENQSDNTNHVSTTVPHILRCTRPDTFYSGNKTGVNFIDRLAVVVPFGVQNYLKPNEDKIHETVNFEFVCQNSCATGMNRRSTVVIFTLENDRYEIFGKKLMNFKVCSCPKRDKEKEEESMHDVPATKRKLGHSSGKRPMKKACLPNNQIIKKEPGILSPQDSTEILDGVNGGNQRNSDVTITLTLPDKISADHVLRCAFNEIAGRMAMDNGAKTDLYKPYYKKIKRTMDQFNCSP